MQRLIYHSTVTLAETCGHDHRLDTYAHAAQARAVPALADEFNAVASAQAIDHVRMQDVRKKRWAHNPAGHRGRQGDRGPGYATISRRRRSADGCHRGSGVAGQRLGPLTWLTVACALPPLHPSTFDGGVDDADLLQLGIPDDTPPAAADLLYQAQARVEAHAARLLADAGMWTRAATESTPSPQDQHVTLNQAAAIVNRSKTTLRRRYDDGDLPHPDVHGGGGNPHEWKWSKIRPVLEELYRRPLPKHFPRFPR
jgi:hypothetical protein